MYKDHRNGGRYHDWRRKTEFKVCVYKKWRYLLRGICVAGLSG